MVGIYFSRQIDTTSGTNKYQSTVIDNRDSKRQCCSRKVINCCLWDSGEKREGLKADADMAQAEARALLPTAV